MLVVDYDHAVSRHFDEDSRRHLSLLRKAVFQGHITDHRVTHFETNGVVVTSHAAPKPPIPLEALKPVSKHVN
jgi:hypothetical protein